ncbi:hypothetical protein ACOMHN_000995 [Nucella lapillus]
MASKYADWVSVASCEAVKNSQQILDGVERVVNNITTEVNKQLGGLTEDVYLLRKDVDELLGVDKVAVPITLTKAVGNGTFDTRLICQINNELEADEICRALDFRIPNTYFFHLNCNDARVVTAGISCPTNDWVFTPGCITSATADITDCAVVAGFTCQSILSISCSGYAPNPGLLTVGNAIVGDNN